MDGNSALLHQKSIVVLLVAYPEERLLLSWLHLFSP